mgnify:CR=1 FL=1
MAQEDIESKKAQVLMIYKLIFRFSIEKLTNYLKNDMFIVILLQYIKNTSFGRIHARQVLSKNKVAYYRALENMVNLGEKQDQILQTLRQNFTGPDASVSKIMDHKHYHISLNDQNEKYVSFSEL